MRNKEKKIILVSTPFLEYTLPSAQLAALQAYLEVNNISVCSLFSYVKFYEILGKYYADILNNSEYAEWIYYQFLYEEQYKKDKEKIDDKIKKKLILNNEELEDLTNKIRKFNEWLLDKILKLNCPLVGFSITYNQLLPSLYIAQQLKKSDSKMRIIFGGSRVNGELGSSLQKTCNYIDTILSGEGERILCQYIIDYYKSGVDGEFASQRYIDANEFIDINSLPTPEYRDYIAIIKECNLNTENIYYFYEVARGCWWNRCTFCSSLRLYKKYREKNPETVVKDISQMKAQYNVNKIWLLGDCYSFASYKKMSELIVVNKADFIFMAYSRCSLEKAYYDALKKMGANAIMIGIEAISDSLLLKMDKGCTAIANIQCLKICSELNINCVYNLFYSYPNFDKNDFVETIDNIVYVAGYQPPESICDMELQYGSKIYLNPSKYGIAKYCYSEFDRLSLPECAMPFKFDYKKSHNTDRYSKVIIQKVQEWNKAYEIYGRNNILYYKIEGNSLVIYDNRPSMSIHRVCLNGYKKSVFLYCETIKSFDEILYKFGDIDEKKIQDALRWFVSCKIMFSSNDKYLSLPVYING